MWNSKCVFEMAFDIFTTTRKPCTGESYTTRFKCVLLCVLCFICFMFHRWHAFHDVVVIYVSMARVMFLYPVFAFRVQRCSNKISCLTGVELKLFVKQYNLKYVYRHDIHICGRRADSPNVFKLLTTHAVNRMIKTLKTIRYHLWQIRVHINNVSLLTCVACSALHMFHVCHKIHGFRVSCIACCSCFKCGCCVIFVVNVFDCCYRVCSNELGFGIMLIQTRFENCNQTYFPARWTNVWMTWFNQFVQTCITHNYK